MAANLTPVNKFILENTMYVYHIRDGTQSTSLVSKIEIHKFSKMKHNEVYKKQLSHKNWILYVLKNERETVTITLRTFSGSTYDVKCQVKYCKASFSHTIWAKKVSYDEYIIELTSGILHARLNEFLEKDTLFCKLYITSSTDARILRPVTESMTERKDGSVLCMNGLKEDTAEMALVRDLGNVEWMKFTDFKIRTCGTVVGVSKGLLAARSKFFFDYLKENPDSEEIKLDTSPAAFLLALEYVYWGNFLIGSISTMLELIKLAKKLQMKRLHEMSRNYVKYSINASNVHLIREMGADIGEEELVSSADQFLARK